MKPLPAKLTTAHQLLDEAIWSTSSDFQDVLAAIREYQFAVETILESEGYDTEPIL